MEIRIILFRGRPGVGKTTISNALSTRTNLHIIRKYDIYDVASEFVQEHQTRNKISYNSLYKILESNINTNCAFILDYPFHSPEHFAIIYKWCKDRKVELMSILVTCSDENIWAERFNKRAENPLPNQVVTNFEELRNHYGNMQVDPEEGELTIDTI